MVREGGVYHKLNKRLVDIRSCGCAYEMLRYYRGALCSATGGGITPPPRINLKPGTAFSYPPATRVGGPIHDLHTRERHVGKVTAALGYKIHPSPSCQAPSAMCNSESGESEPLVPHSLCPRDPHICLLALSLHVTLKNQSSPSHYIYIQLRVLYRTIPYEF